MTPAACRQLVFRYRTATSHSHRRLVDCSDLSSRCLPNHALRNGSCLQSIIEAKSSDVRVGANSLDSCQVLNLSVYPDFCHVGSSQEYVVEVTDCLCHMRGDQSHVVAGAKADGVIVGRPTLLYERTMQAWMLRPVAPLNASTKSTVWQGDRACLRATLNPVQFQLQYMYSSNTTSFSLLVYRCLQLKLSGFCYTRFINHGSPHGSQLGPVEA